MMDVLRVQDPAEVVHISASYAGHESFYVIAMSHHRKQIEVLMSVESHRRKIARMMNLGRGRKKKNFDQLLHYGNFWIRFVGIYPKTLNLLICASIIFLAFKFISTQGHVKGGIRVFKYPLNRKCLQFARVY